MRWAAVIACVLMLGACGFGMGTTPPLAGAEGASAVVTGRTVSDHVISWTTGKNCSTKRRNLGLTYCEEDEKNPVSSVYCYRTLGSVSCYEKADPFRDNQSRVGVNSQNLPGGF